MDKKGFTLVELLVTVAILAILTSIALPLYTGYQKGAARQEATANLQGLSLCLEEYYAERGNYGTAGTYRWENNGATNNFASWLPCFQPKKASGGATNKYNYRLDVQTSTTYIANATGALRPVLGDTPLTLNQNSDKTGPWPK